jgi:hypothetical protein
MDDIQQVICQCQKVLKKQSNDFTNGANHVKSQHKKEYESKVQEYLQLKAKGQKSVLDFVSTSALAFAVVFHTDFDEVRYLYSDRVRVSVRSPRKVIQSQSNLSGTT